MVKISNLIGQTFASEWLSIIWLLMIQTSYWFNEVAKQLTTIIIIYSYFLTTITCNRLLPNTDARSIGVCYGQIGDGLPSEQDVVNLYRRNGITKMRIYAPNQATL
ncbi:putative glucan endo-1,3-beta-D-glucosidase [Helianthus annuus]|nr:putative glucan endo-1,3-beta-D-glucosidase [Helianthus annuus]